MVGFLLWSTHHNTTSKLQVDPKYNVWWTLNEWQHDFVNVWQMVVRASNIIDTIMKKIQIFDK